MGGKGGKVDASPMLEYGDKALALQKEQYDYSKQISQPWLNTGTSAINQLSNLMGLSGGGNQSRQSIYDSLAPQYTTQTAATPQTNGNFYINTKGQVVDANTFTRPQDALSNLGYDVTSNGLRALAPDAVAGSKQQSQILERLGYKPMTTTSGSAGGQTIDQAGLNAAVDSAYANQTPSADFGKLLQTYTGQDIYQDPSYKFRLEQGNKAMERQLAASGKYLTPAASLALQEYGQNMGSQEFGNAYNRFNNDQGNLYNRLAGLAGMGQTQTGQVIGAGQNYSNAGTDILTGQGNAIVSANQANQANKGSMFNTLLGAGSALGSAYLTGGASAGAGGLYGGGFTPLSSGGGINWFSDERLKTNIKLIGQENGHNIYEFAYKTDPEKKFIGVLAQEVQKTHPEAVEEINGYLAVDYDKIGVNFVEA